MPKVFFKISFSLFLVLPFCVKSIAQNHAVEQRAILNTSEIVKASSLETIRRIEAEYNLTDPLRGNEREALVERITLSALNTLDYMKEKQDLLQRNIEVVRWGLIYRVSELATFGAIAVLYPDVFKTIAPVLAMPTTWTRDLIHASWRSYQAGQEIKKLTGSSRGEITARLFSVRDLSPIHIHSFEIANVPSFLMIKRESFGHIADLFLELFGIQKSHPYLTRAELETALRRNLTGGAHYLRQLKVEAPNSYEYSRMLLEAVLKYAPAEDPIRLRIQNQSRPIAARHVNVIYDHIWQAEQWNRFSQSKYHLIKGLRQRLRSHIEGNAELRAVLSSYSSLTNQVESRLNAYELLSLKLMSEINSEGQAKEATLESREKLKAEMETSLKKLERYQSFFHSKSRVLTQNSSELRSSISSSLRAFRCQMSVMGL